MEEGAALEGVFHGSGGASSLAYLASGLQVALIPGPRSADRGVTVPQLPSILAWIDYSSLESPVEAR
jgi:hypothetical protein